MTPTKLYELLDQAGIEFDIVEIFEGVRFLRVVVEEETDNESEISEIDHD